MNNFLKRILSSVIILPLIVYFIFQGSILLIGFITFCALIACYEWHMMTKNYLYKFYGFIFLAVVFYNFYLISIDIWKVFFVLIICISTDIGGYTFGKIFKGPKLIKISPNKTYAGVIGAYLLSIISLIIYFSYFNTQQILSKEIFMITILISTISQIGDLVISYFKRKSKIKNTGKIIPGHGGILDRIDGMIFAFPLFNFIDQFYHINL